MISVFGWTKLDSSSWIPYTAIQTFTPFNMRPYWSNNSDIWKSLYYHWTSLINYTWFDFNNSFSLLKISDVSISLSMPSLQVDSSTWKYDVYTQGNNSVRCVKEYYTCAEYNWWNWKVILNNPTIISEQLQWINPSQACYVQCDSNSLWNDVAKKCELVVPKWAEDLEPTTIWCSEWEPDIIAIIDWKKIRIAWCNAYWTSWAWVPLTTSTDINWTHYYYYWQEAFDWCNSKGWRLPTNNEFTDMKTKFMWTYLESNNINYKPKTAKQTSAPFNFYPAWYWENNKFTDLLKNGIYWSNTEISGDSSSVYTLYFDWYLSKMKKTTNALTTRCVKDYN